MASKKEHKRRAEAKARRARLSRSGRSAVIRAASAPPVPKTPDTPEIRGLPPLGGAVAVSGAAADAAREDGRLSDVTAEPVAIREGSEPIQVVDPDSLPAYAPPPALEVDPAYFEGVPRLGYPGGAASEADIPEENLPAGHGVFGTVSAKAPVTFEDDPAAAVAEEYFGEDDSGDGWSMPEYRTTRVLPKEKRLYIVMIAPEVAPTAKVGGLGDVVQGLGRELMNRGHEVEVIAPMYSCMRYDTIHDLHEIYGELWSPHFNEWRSEKVYQGWVEGLKVNFITGGIYSNRPSIYGFDDDLYRFAYFSRQALEFLFKSGRRPDIIHCHDWTTGLVPAMLWDIYGKMGWNNSRVVYTIHNNECQGLCGFGDKLLGMVGLDVRNYLRMDRMQDDARHNCINMMKAGIVYSNFVTTVSPTYAGELKTVVGGRGLQNTIAKNAAKVGGVLNGLDYEAWNPQTDQKIAARYSIGDDFFEKYKNKTALREWLGLWDAWKPIVSVVTRLTHQKGLDLIKRAIFATIEEQGQYVLLGSAPDPKVNADFLRLQHELKDNHDVNLYIGYHEDLSRLIYAGSDIFLVPSLYEPCGLTQMIALRYGAVPVVRETGGLVDTVFDLENSGKGLNNANGFSFRDATPESLDYGLKRAIRLWYDNPPAFNRLARNGMRYNYSWKNPAKDYENIYNYIKA
ncbi:MAG: glycogen synthase [Planctomycetota bacterium]|jgi:starch synthase|nr:glycogen synthase [Planctomycetota bacterium]